MTAISYETCKYHIDRLANILRTDKSLSAKRKDEIKQELEKWKKERTKALEKQFLGLHKIGD